MLINVPFTLEKHLQTILYHYIFVHIYALQRVNFSNFNDTVAVHLAPLSEQVKKIEVNAV